MRKLSKIIIHTREILPLLAGVGLCIAGVVSAVVSRDATFALLAIPCGVAAIKETLFV